MRTFSFAILLVSSLALAQPARPSIAISSTVSGVAAEDLADTPVTDAINMEAGQVSNQLSLTLSITPGTSLLVDVSCAESSDGTNYGAIVLCDSDDPSACVPDTRRFTFSDFTADASGDYQISTRWPVTKKWVKCTVDDPADGTGEITITGSRSWQ
jgi:hypothetical protein